MSTAAVAADNASGIHMQSDDHAAIPVDTSRTSVGVDVSAVADVSLPPVPDVAMPAPIDDLSFHAGSFIAEPPSVAPADDFGDDTAFNETLQSAAADITLFAVSLPLLRYRLAAHLVNLEARESESDCGKSLKMGKSGKVCYCVWYNNLCNMVDAESYSKFGNFVGTERLLPCR